MPSEPVYAMKGNRICVFVENSKEYTNAAATKQQEMKDEAFEQFTALLFMRGANNDFKETYNGFG